MQLPTDLRVSQRSGTHLIFEPLGEGMVIYDRQTNRAHLLDSVATMVWRAGAIDSLVSDLLPKAPGLVHVAIHDLEAAGLIVTNRDQTQRLSRRRLMKGLGSAVALPLVVSIVAPTAAAAASQVGNCAVCTGGVTDTCATAGRTCQTGMNGTRCCVAGRVDTRCNGDAAMGMMGAQCCSGAIMMGLCVGD